VPFVFGGRFGPREFGVAMSEKRTVSEAAESKTTEKKEREKKECGEAKEGKQRGDVRKRVSTMVKAKR